MNDQEPEEPREEPGEAQELSAQEPQPAGDLADLELSKDGTSDSFGDEPPQETVRPRRRRLRWILLGVLILLAMTALYQVLTWPDVAALAEDNPATTAFLEDYRREAEAEGKPAPQWRWAPYPRIAGSLKLAVVASEDMEFFDHQGFSQHEMKVALKQAWEEGKGLRGASTITQQLAKNLWLSPSRNPWRKVKEALLTRQLEEHLEKRRILEIYLNVVEFGPGVYGAEAAARRYFGTSAAGLSNSQAAALAAALPNPTRWYPGSGSKTAARRAARIEARMGQAGWIRRNL